MGINNLGFGFKAQPNQAQAVREGDKTQRGGACYAPNHHQVAQGIKDGMYKNGEVMTMELDDGRVVTGTLVVKYDDQGRLKSWYLDTTQNNNKK